MTEETTSTERSPRYHHGDLKAALIGATLDLIREKRVEDLSVADAARAAGVSSGAPYRHFKDREELLAHVAAEGFRQLGECTQSAMTSHPTGSIEGIIAGGCAYTEFGASNPELFHLMWGSARAKSAHETAQTASTDCYMGFIGGLTETMRVQGLGHLDPHQFGAPLWAMVHGFASLVIGQPKMLNTERSAIRDRIAAASWAYFRGMAQRAP